jgi:selenocysteine lyase/cysteine desulfurase
MRSLSFGAGAGFLGIALLLAFALAVASMGCSAEPTVSQEAGPTLIPVGRHLERAAIDLAESSAESSIDALRRNGIACGVRNGRIRISLAPYNNSADLDALIDVLASS